jgi:type I restriction enzyme R subunit
MASFAGGGGRNGKKVDSGVRRETARGPSRLKGWVERVLGEMQNQDIAIKRASTKAELQQLDADFRGLIIAMIHKFEAIRPNSSTRDNIFVFIDEAHRSVAKDLGTYLMASVPNATIIGFTGTPIADTEQGKGTFKIFGAEDKTGYLDKYSIRESIEDETTVPIKHVLAPSEITVPVDRLDKEFFELLSLRRRWEKLKNF